MELFEGRPRHETIFDLSCLTIEFLHLMKSAKQEEKVYLVREEGCMQVIVFMLHCPSSVALANKNGNKKQSLGKLIESLTSHSQVNFDPSTSKASTITCTTTTVTTQVRQYNHIFFQVTLLALWTLPLSPGTLKHPSIKCIGVGSTIRIVGFMKTVKGMIGLYG